MAKGMEVALHCHHCLWLSSLFQNALGQTLALGEVRGSRPEDGRGVPGSGRVAGPERPGPGIYF